MLINAITPDRRGIGSLSPGERAGVRARELRVNSTDAERLLWSKLRNRQLLGSKFRRQVPIGHYIADFVCLDAKLIIELDGGQHSEMLLADAKRSNDLGALGFTVIRFWNNEVLSAIESVMQHIHQSLLALLPSPQPSPQGRGGL